MKYSEQLAIKIPTKNGNKYLGSFKFHFFREHHFFTQRILFMKTSRQKLITENPNMPTTSHAAFTIQASNKNKAPSQL